MDRQRKREKQRWAVANSDKRQTQSGRKNDIEKAKTIEN